jgi:lipid II:glycine glycyltransferase (peptidoglycan interpeptide bridge formation enzyme)
LQTQQNNVKDKINTVARKLEENYKVVDKENDIDKKIALLEQYIKEERLLLAGINL